MGFEPVAQGRWDGSPVRYPDPAVRVLDPRFEKYRVDSAAVERLATGCRWTEGPVWFGDMRCLLWSDIPNDRILRWDEQTGSVTVFREPSGFANGHCRDVQGRLVSCEHLTRRVTRTEPDGAVTVLLDSFDGKRLNAPNDVAVRRDGSVWFTDPGYGIMSDYEGRRAEFELPTAVYRVAPDGDATAVVTSLARPNGLCFSPDETLLYVVDSGSRPSTIHVFPADGAARVGPGRVFADMSPGTSDGIRCDVDGNVWSAAGGGGDGYDGVHVFAPDGTLIGQVLLPEQVSNLCFGGRGNSRLFVTASQSVYSLYTRAAGAI